MHISLVMVFIYCQRTEKALSQDKPVSMETLLQYENTHKVS